MIWFRWILPIVGLTLYAAAGYVGWHRGRLRQERDLFGKQILIADEVLREDHGWRFGGFELKPRVWRTSVARAWWTNGPYTAELSKGDGPATLDMDGPHMNGVR